MNNNNIEAVHGYYLGRHSRFYLVANGNIDQVRSHFKHEADIEIISYSNFYDIRIGASNERLCANSFYLVVDLETDALSAVLTSDLITYCSPITIMTCPKHNLITDHNTASILQNLHKLAMAVDLSNYDDSKREGILQGIGMAYAHLFNSDSE